MAEHHCHARGCKTPVPPRMLMCAPHWRRVPKDLQARVWATYREGQEIRKDPSRVYLAAAEAAIASVAVQEIPRAAAQGELFGEASVPKGAQH